MSYIYLASPYTHPDYEVRLRRYLAVEAATAHLIRKGEVVYSPIVHCHVMALRHELPTDFNFWREQCITMLASAYELFVLPLAGHETSVGVRDEVAFAVTNKMPVTYLALNELGDSFWLQARKAKNALESSVAGTV